MSASVDRAISMRRCTLLPVRKGSLGDAMIVPSLPRGRRVVVGDGRAALAAAAGLVLVTCGQGSVLLGGRGTEPWPHPEPWSPTFSGREGLALGRVPLDGAGARRTANRPAGQRGHSKDIRTAPHSFLCPLFWSALQNIRRRVGQASDGFGFGHGGRANAQLDYFEKGFIYS